MVPLSIFFGIPETDRQDTIRFRIRYQKGLIRESGLFFQNRQYFVVDEGSEVSCLSRLGGYFDSACKHGNTPCALVLNRRRSRLPVEADRLLWWVTGVESVLQPTA